MISAGFVNSISPAYSTGPFGVRLRGPIRWMSSFVLCVTPLFLAMPMLFITPLLISHGTRAASELSTLEMKIESCLIEKIRDEDRWISDYAILLASRYQRIQDGTAEPHLSKGGRRTALEKLLEDCQSEKKRERLGLKRLRGDQVPRLEDRGDRAALRRAITLGREHLDRPRHKENFGGRFHVRQEDLLRTLNQLETDLDESHSDEDLTSRIRSNFDIFQSKGDFSTDEVLFTAYAFPIFEGANSRSDVYQVPVHKVPSGKSSHLRHLTRAEIAQGGLDGLGLELAWFKDPIDAFLLEVQGSGGIQLSDGGFLRLSYAEKNGHAYRSLGKLLVADAKLTAWEVSIPAIRQYFDEHPQEMRGYLDQNPSYVYFTSEETADAPHDLSLEGGHTLASDKSYFPRGALAFVDLTLPPDQKGSPWSPFRRFMIDLDRGGAIKGPGHIDLYFGNTPLAFRRAGTVKHPGKLFYLLKKGTRLLP